LIGDVVSRQRDSRAGRVKDDALAKTDLGITVKPFEPIKAGSDLGHLVRPVARFSRPMKMSARGMVNTVAVLVASLVEDDRE
jgi:hypothetical protein